MYTHIFIYIQKGYSWGVFFVNCRNVCVFCALAILVWNLTDKCLLLFANQIYQKNTPRQINVFCCHGSDFFGLFSFFGLFVFFFWCIWFICFFWFWFAFYRDLPDNRRYLLDDKRHL